MLGGGLSNFFKMKMAEMDSTSSLHKKPTPVLVKNPSRKESPVIKKMISIYFIILIGCSFNARKIKTTTTNL